MQFWQSGQSFPAQLPEIIRKKVHKRCKNFSKLFSSNCSHGEVESPADFFSRASRTFSARYSKKLQFVSFAKNFHPKVSIETENPVLTTRLLFCEFWSQKMAQCPKMKKKLEIKVFFVEKLFWTRRMQF